MHCFNCSSPIPEDLKFCPQCGMPVDESTEDISAAETPAEKPAAEAPAVETVPAADLFGEELDPLSEEAVFGTSEDKEDHLSQEEAMEQADLALAEDGSLDPTSPDFDPRKFAGLDQEAFRPMAAAELLEETAEEEPEVAAPKAKKQGKGGIVALVIALVLVLAAAAAGLLYWLTAPAKELVLEDNFIQFMSLDTEEKVTAFTVDARETDRFRRTDTVWCSVTTEDGSVHAERDYVMNYRLTREGWKLTHVDELNIDTWVLKPLAGASEEELAAALTGQKIAVSDTYAYSLTAEDAASVEILDRTTDLEAGTELVQATVCVVSELVGWTTEVELELAFAQGWQAASFTHGVPEVEFKPGMEFELTEEDFLKVLMANPIPLMQSTDDVTTTVVADGEAVEEAATAAQTVKVSKSRVSELTVLETVFDMEENTQTVVVEFLLDKTVAKLHVEAAISYVFEDGWKVSALTYTPTVKEIVLDGEWKGTYTESEGRTPSVTLTVADNEDGTDNNVFAFGPSEANPYFFTGKYYVSDEADVETLAVSLKATDWVLYYNPGGVALVGLEGSLMIDDGVITDGKTFTITLQREEEAAEEETEDLSAYVVPVMEAEPAVGETVAPAPEASEPGTETAAPGGETTAPTEETAKPALTPAEEDIADEDEEYLGTWDTPVM